MRDTTVGLLALAMLAVGIPTVAATVAAAESVDTTCVLPLTKFDPAAINVAYPDQAATYWVGGYQAAPGTRIRIQGRYPHSRYMSFNVYDQLQRPLDAIGDFQIAPDPGSTNPFIKGAKRDAEPRNYTAYIDFGPKPANPADRAPNTLYAGTGQPIGDIGTSNYNGTFIYRVYIPDDGLDETGGVGLPTITLQAADGGPAPKSACADFAKPPVEGVNEPIANSDASVPDATNFARETPRWRKFTNPVDAYAYVEDLNSDTTQQLGGSGGFLSNVHNQYLHTSISRRFGQVLVTRLRAPSFPDTRGGRRTMPGGDLRYFSMCQNERTSQRFIGCATDDQSVVGKDGFITYVVSTPEDRPAFATPECGVTWLPWGPTEEGLLIYRHMLPSRNFEQAIQYATVDHEVDTMGDYFPVSRYYPDKAAYDGTVGCNPDSATSPGDTLGLGL